MAEPLKSIGAITLFVADPQRSKEFYARVLDADVAFEDENSVAFNLDNLILNLLQRGAPVDELLGPIAAGEAGASFQLTVWVEDADAVCADLTKLGVEVVNGPVTRSWGVRTANFLDPDGYLWEIAAQIR